MKTGNHTILIVSGRAFNLYRSRLPLMKHLLNKGWVVHAAAYRHDNYEKKLEDQGVIFHHIPFVRAKLSVPGDVSALLILRKYIKQICPDVIHFFNTKPILLSGFISKPKISTICACTLTGIGFHSRSFKNSIILRAFKFSLSKKDAVIFENNDDKSFCLHHNFQLPESNHVQISSGVDLDKFRYLNKIENAINILFAGRLVKSKGINELLEASLHLKKKYGSYINIRIAGEYDSVHPDGIDYNLLNKSSVSGIIQYLGAISPDEMEIVMSEANIVILPSYREGFSKVLMEAASSGKALAASNVPGCREIVVNNDTGILFEPRSSQEIILALSFLIDNPHKVIEYGENARMMAENKFSQIAIATDTFNIYKTLLPHLI